MLAQELIPQNSTDIQSEGHPKVDKREMNQIEHTWNELDNLFETKTKDTLAKHAVDLINQPYFSLKPVHTVVLLVATLKRPEHNIMYADIIEFSYDQMPKVMSEGTAFNACRDLTNQGLLIKSSEQQRTAAGRPRELFSITAAGANALFLALKLAKFLAEIPQQEAA